ncbi:response regulator [Pseudahrensia aquimaris]|uniref:Response regulator n=1 Tax=Pseudahrensia aquimaris TaxID=744461 RepID=A0ABW3FEN3_9HYPH
MKHILIADDEPHIADVIEFALQNAGYQTSRAADGASALKAFNEKMPDLIVLDVGMPVMDGLDVCRTIRKTSDCPILFLSARDEEVDRIVGLEIGGDDYVTKPFSPRELVARIGTILKRARVAEPQDATACHGIITVDRERRAVRVGGAAVTLTSTEFDMLALLLSRPGAVYNRAQLLDQVWPDNIHVSDRTIDSHVRNLRNKLRDAGCADAVRTVHGVGFQLDRCEGKA